jgi:hypothetical protein
MFKRLFYLLLYAATSVPAYALDADALYGFDSTDGQRWRTAAEAAAALDHDSTQNFEANEHLDWTSDQGATNIHTGNYVQNTTLATSATDVTATAAEVNILDLSATALTTGWGYLADGASSASWRKLLGSEITNDSGWTSFTPTDIDTDYADETVTSTWTFIDNGTGAMGAYDLLIGDVVTPDFGALQIGRTGIYSSSFSASGLDIGGAMLFRQESNIDVGNDPGIEFVWMEQGNTIRLAIPESGAGNATAFIRSGTFAGPYSAVTGNATVTCNQWSAYDSNIDCDTGSTGADLFIQDDLEVEGTIYAHETINLEGATADGNQVILQVGADPGSDVTLTLPTATGTLVTVGTDLPLAGGTMTGQIVTDNLGIEFEDSDTNPTCAAGNYAIWADLSETTLKKCLNGVTTDLDTGGAGGTDMQVDTGGSLANADFQDGGDINFAEAAGVVTATIPADTVTLDMMADIATDTFLGRVTAATGTVEVLTNAQAKTALDLTGTNSGDQNLADTVAEISDLDNDAATLTIGASATVTGSNTGDEVAADLTTQGIIEIATVAETNTGTDATRAVSPDGLDGWTGSVQVATVGTITSGTWNGTDVAIADGGTGSGTAAGAATNLGLGTGDSPQFTAVNIGHATDTTLARVSAGVASIEGVNVVRHTVDSDINMNGSDLTDVHEIDIDGLPDTDHTANGQTTRTFNAGVTVAVGQIVYLDSTPDWNLTDADAEATSKGMLAISVEAGTATNPMRVALSGSFVRDDTWAWTIGQTLYLSTTAGGITGTQPSGAADIVRVIGYAVSADVIRFEPSGTWIEI